MRPYAIWRRVHQLPTASWCEVHREPLCFAAQQSAAFLADPMEIHKSGNWYTDDFPSAWIDNRAIRNMHRIAKYLLAANRPWKLDAIVSRIRQRSEATELDGACGFDEARHIAELAFSRFPKAYLYEFIPSLENRRGSCIPNALYATVIDGTTAPGANALVLALSVLYDSPEQALCDCMTPSHKGRGSSLARRPPDT